MNDGNADRGSTMTSYSKQCALQSEHDEPLRVMALHALEYCPRLFYLEEVEEIRKESDRVFAGRALHESIAADCTAGQIKEVEVTAEALGLTGKIDCICRRNGKLIPYEHKRGRSKRVDGNSKAWPPDALQVAAYAMMLEEAKQITVTEGRIRYHADQTTVSVSINQEMRNRVRSMIEEGKRLRTLTERPPVTPHEKKCVKCSLAPICLPEEERAVAAPARKTKRLFPKNRSGGTVHIVTAGTHIGRSGESFHIVSPDGAKKDVPVVNVDALVIDGYSQITTQALQLCAINEIGVHWLTPSGSYLGGFAAGVGPVQRRIRQYKALCDEKIRLRLTQTLVKAKIEQTLRYLLRCARTKTSNSNSATPLLDIAGNEPICSPKLNECIDSIRRLLKRVDQTNDIDAIRGLEGAAAKAYFVVVPELLKPNVPKEMVPLGRSRRPPRDRFNALLSYLYSLLYASVLQAELVVGLEPAFGFYHTPRSSTPPLTLDLMELFRLVLCDIPLIGSINRLQWDVIEDFECTSERVWLSQAGKRKTIELYERRLQDEWKHPVVGYSLSYYRLIELETRLLEKEWSGDEGLFAKFRIR